MYRRTVLKTLAAGATAVMMGTSARADRFPERPVRIILGYPAGGTTDLILRTIVQVASRHLGQSIIIENRPGAASLISLIATKNAAPDGYTLSISTVAAFTAPIQIASTYDPLRDSTYIIGLTNVTYGIVVHADSPLMSWADLVQYARTQPGKTTYGAPAGPGNTGHQAMSIVSEKDILDMTMIPYKGSTDLQQALLGRHITFAADGSGGFIPMVHAGRERLLAVLTEERMPLFPNVPSLKELGYPAAFDSPWGLVGPPDMDPRAVAILHDAFKKALEDREVQAAIIAAGQFTRYFDSAAYKQYAIEENERQWRQLGKLGLAQKR